MIGVRKVFQPQLNKLSCESSFEFFLTKSPLNMSLRRSIGVIRNTNELFFPPRPYSPDSFLEYKDFIKYAAVIIRGFLNSVNKIEQQMLNRKNSCMIDQLPLFAQNHFPSENHWSKIFNHKSTISLHTLLFNSSNP
jgi:hypothetical protein